MDQAWRLSPLRQGVHHPYGSAAAGGVRERGWCLKVMEWCYRGRWGLGALCLWVQGEAGKQVPPTEPRPGHPAPGNAILTRHVCCFHGLCTEGRAGSARAQHILTSCRNVLCRANYRFVWFDTFCLVF